MTDFAAYTSQPVCPSVARPEVPDTRSEAATGLLQASNSLLTTLNDRWRVVDVDGQWVLEQRTGTVR